MPCTSIMVGDKGFRAYYSAGSRHRRYLGPWRETLAEAERDRKRFYELSDTHGTQAAIKLAVAL